MFPGIDLLAWPLGWLLWGVYKLVSNYFIAIFLFTLIVRIVTFPFSLKSQKAQCDRARLAPRLERLQKKYKSDPKKLQAKQMQLYEKEGVSMTGGCLPMLVPMIVLFGVIAVIYSPLTHLAKMPKEVVTKSIEVVSLPEKAEADANKISHKDKSSYYKELRLLLVLDKADNETLVRNAISGLDASVLAGKSADEYLKQMHVLKKDFNFFGNTLLEMPWHGFSNINILWLIPIISGLTALASSFISMRFMKATQGDTQPGQGCSNVMMLVMMPAFSLFITFTVPGGVGVYWICSNMIAVLQTVVSNKIYSPAKARAKAFEEDAERRQRKREDKQRLAEARAREEEEQRQLAAEERERIAEKIEQGNKPKQAAPSKNPNKQKRRENTEDEAENALYPKNESEKDEPEADLTLSLQPVDPPKPPDVPKPPETE